MRCYFAPMEGITGALYRGAHRRFFPGVDKYFMPFLSPTHGHTFTKRELRDILPEHNEGVPAVPQLLTRRAEDFLWAAGELAAMGYREVNLNLGCPSGTVTAKGKGAGFLARPDELEAFLDEIFAKAPLAISVKTRLGLSDPEEFGPLLELYNRYPIAELTIHPRVQQDFYRRPVRPGAFAAALPRSTNPVCYNGDITSAARWRALEEEYPGLGAAMIGRALVGNPGLSAVLAGGSAPNRDTLRDFHDQLYESYCAAFGSRQNAALRMKEIWFYHIHLFRDSARHGKALRKAADPAAFERAAAAVFRELELLPELEPGW